MRTSNIKVIYLSEMSSIMTCYLCGLNIWDNWMFYMPCYSWHCNTPCGLHVNLLHFFATTAILIIDKVELHLLLLLWKLMKFSFVKWNVQKREHDCVFFTFPTIPPRKLILSTFAPSRKSIIQVNWYFSSAVVSPWKGLSLINSINMCAFIMI